MPIKFQFDKEWVATTGMQPIFILHNWDNSIKITEKEWGSQWYASGSYIRKIGK